MECSISSVIPQKLQQRLSPDVRRNTSKIELRVKGAQAYVLSVKTKEEPNLPEEETAPEVDPFMVAESSHIQSSSKPKNSHQCFSSIENSLGQKSAGNDDEPLEQTPEFAWWPLACPQTDASKEEDVELQRDGIPQTYYEIIEDLDLPTVGEGN